VINLNDVLKRVITGVLLMVLCFPQVAFAEEDKIHVEARNAIAIDGESKMVLYEKNSNDIVSIASTTKIMTSLVALNYGDLSQKIEISKNAASIRGSQVGYSAGEKITMEELLFGLMHKSGNDAAIAIAEGTAGSVEEFSKLMNEYAMSIGAKNSHFESPHGLDSQNHYSTAYDLAIITAAAKRIPKFNEIVRSKGVQASNKGFTRDYHNINKILHTIPGANGVKTGYTGQAGKCLVTSVNKGGRDIIIVTLNCPGRWKETQKIFNYVNKKYEYKKIANKGEVLEKFKVQNSITPVEIFCDEDVIIPLDTKCRYEVVCKKPTEPIYAPIEKGDEIGHI
jgi:serine-type D-Ala-D-Ala carboxypeptidase (penicillin-binding protein 5/6)